MKKIIALTALIGIPIMIILFLNFFGENKYTLSVFYENKLPESIKGCHLDTPHHVSIPSRLKNEYFGYLFADNTRMDDIQEIQRLPGDLNNSIQCVKLKESRDLNDKWILLEINIENFRKCELLIPGFKFENEALPLVLVDETGRIRGYYNGLIREEVDRLITETRILVNETNAE